MPVYRAPNNPLRIPDRAGRFSGRARDSFDMYVSRGGPPVQKGYLYQGVVN
jgi:hypothetical protein